MFRRCVARMRRGPRRPYRGPPDGGDPAPLLASATVNPERPSTEVLNRAAFERLRAAMGAGFLDELLSTFVEDAKELVSTMRRALGEKDVDAFRRAAHSLKSNAASVGALTLSSMARELEMLAKSGIIDGARSRVDRLAVECERVARALREVEREPRA